MLTYRHGHICRKNPSSYLSIHSYAHLRLVMTAVENWCALPTVISCSYRGLDNLSLFSAPPLNSLLLIDPYALYSHGNQTEIIFDSICRKIHLFTKICFTKTTDFPLGVHVVRICVWKQRHHDAEKYRNFLLAPFLLLYLYKNILRNINRTFFSISTTSITRAWRMWKHTNVMTFVEFFR